MIFELPTCLNNHLKFNKEDTVCYINVIYVSFYA